MIDVQTVRCPDCGHSFDFASYVGEEISDNNLRLMKRAVQRTSWEELSNEAGNDRAALWLDIGDTLDFEFKNGQKVSVEVAALNPYGNGAVLSFTNVLKDYRMNRTDTNRGGWCECDMEDYLEKEILQLLPDDLTECIIPRKIVQKQGERTYEKECKLWLPSYTEVFGFHDRYSQCDVGDVRFPLFETRRGRTKYTLDDDLSYWWLRSPSVGYSTHFWYVNYNGNGGNNGASYAIGVCPCFIIGKSN